MVRLLNHKPHHHHKRLCLPSSCAKDTALFTLSTKLNLAMYCLQTWILGGSMETALFTLRRASGHAPVSPLHIRIEIIESSSTAPTTLYSYIPSTYIHKEMNI